MRQLSLIIGLLITLPTSPWAQESDEERLARIVELQGQTKELQVLKQAWNSYKLGDYEAALSLWMPIAEAGNPSAQVFIGLMYNEGHGVDQDGSKTEKWYSLASEQGYVPAKWRLAMLYYHGSGVTQDYQKAADLYHSAAKQGDVYSQKALGIMYSEGSVVPKDNIIAYSWFHVASKNGFKLAKKFQNDIKNEMTPEEIAIAQNMAKECVNSNYTTCGWAFTSKDGIAEDKH